MILIISMIFMLLLQWNSAADFELDLLQSLERALMCTHRAPPKEPVIALSPKKYSQLVALIKRNLDTPQCDKNKPTYEFDITNHDTWNFCLFGWCSKNRCKCLQSFRGPHCGTYKRRCWMMYCFLNGCHPAHQNLVCKCDPKLYGEKVLTGDYWYDDGKRAEFEFPPPDWQDNVSTEKLPPGQIEVKYERSPQQQQQQYDDYDLPTIEQQNGKSKELIQTGNELANQFNPIMFDNRYTGMVPPENSNPPQFDPGNPNLPVEKAPPQEDAKSGPKNSKSEDLDGDANEDVKEALEEVEKESSSSITNNANTFYVVVVMNVLLILWTSINK